MLGWVRENALENMLYCSVSQKTFHLVTAHIFTKYFKGRVATPFKALQKYHSSFMIRKPFP